MTNEELVSLMKDALNDDEKCLVLGDYLEEKGIEIPSCLATQGLEILLEQADDEEKRRMRRAQRVSDVRVRTLEVLRVMGEHS